MILISRSLNFIV